jgi:hypothetical protein
VKRIVVEADGGEEGKRRRGGESRGGGEGMR